MGGKKEEEILKKTVEKNIKMSKGYPATRYGTVPLFLMGDLVVYLKLGRLTKTF